MPCKQLRKISVISSKSWRDTTPVLQRAAPRGGNLGDCIDITIRYILRPVTKVNLYGRDRTK